MIPRFVFLASFDESFIGTGFGIVTLHIEQILRLISTSILIVPQVSRLIMVIITRAVKGEGWD